jgi:hypothetical protein
VIDCTYDTMAIQAVEHVMFSINCSTPALLDWHMQQAELHLRRYGIVL